MISQQLIVDEEMPAVTVQTEGISGLIPVAAPSVGEREIAYVTDALRSGWVSSIGPYVQRFEQAFADYIGVGHAISVSNGTVGLHLALHALGIGPGDEVLVPDLTFAATAHAVLQTGATPVFVDVEPDTWCIDPVAAEQAITSQTRAIIPVHLYGHPADMYAIQHLAKKHNLLVIEDAAEAHGAEVNGQRVGGLGQVGVFSFYGNKIITTGEGGIVTTNDTALATRLRYIKDHGMSSERRYYHTELAFNYRLTNLQAALGLAQLEQIEHFIQRKQTIFQWYNARLADIPDLQMNTERPGTRNVYWLTCLVLPDNSPLTCQGIAQTLRQKGIDSRPFFVPMHQLPHLARFRTVARDGDSNCCPQAKQLGSQGLSLPSGCQLDQDTINKVARTVIEFLS